MVLSLFEEARRRYADRYTAGPLECLTDGQLVHLAQEAGMTVEGLREHLSTPHVEMTCPLCGRPQTHLTSCRGCGGGAWGYEFEEAHGRDAADRLRRHLREFLVSADGITQNQVHCAVDWNAYLACPLNLLSERVLNGLPQALVYMSAFDTDRRQTIQDWLNDLWRQWVTTAQEAIVEWRAALLHAALMDVPPEGDYD